MLSHITNGFIFIISSFRQSRMFYQCLQMFFLNVICQYCFLHSNNQEMQSPYVWNSHHHLVPILLAHHLAWRRAKKVWILKMYAVWPNAPLITSLEGVQEKIFSYSLLLLQKVKTSVGPFICVHCVCGLYSLHVKVRGFQPVFYYRGVGGSSCTVGWSVTCRQHCVSRRQTQWYSLWSSSVYPRGAAVIGMDSLKHAMTSNTCTIVESATAWNSLMQ